jgi:hypothetical protein
MINGVGGSDEGYQQAPQKLNQATNVQLQKKAGVCRLSTNPSSRYRGRYCSSGLTGGRLWSVQQEGLKAMRQALRDASKS